MVLVPVCCPHCGRDHVVKRGQTANDKQRYLCRNPDCSARTFILDDDDLGRVPAIKKQIIEMALNGSGIRDTARVLRISPSTVISELKKKNPVSNRSIMPSWNG